jgi:hypothetical protein
LVITLIGSGAMLLWSRSFTMVMAINLPPTSALPRGSTSWPRHGHRPGWLARFRAVCALAKT